MAYWKATKEKMPPALCKKKQRCGEQKPLCHIILETNCEDGIQDLYKNGGQGNNFTDWRNQGIQSP
jgi:hypothetical protein